MSLCLCVLCDGVGMLVWSGTWGCISPPHDMPQVQHYTHTPTSLLFSHIFVLMLLW